MIRDIMGYGILQWYRPLGPQEQNGLHWTKVLPSAVSIDRFQMSKQGVEPKL